MHQVNEINNAAFFNVKSAEI
ncbi:protein of unknown function [Candidatus Nitrotoga arctica]|uniref:Uncharacterized protein n=1 Tax=Candidatus Nitrotoga arctica TaxID=453162 RepID=A0ABN8AFZ9_9PROT|nr:protein of unknown function [Candidatus Nitrotoga arctica]